VGLIGKEQLALCKPGVRIVNAARGGLVDEVALAEALSSGHGGGAGIDVFAKEPCTDSPLFGFDNVVVSPHLGASTVEAQDKAGIAVARSVRLALEGEFVPDAVNVQAGGVVVEEVRPALPLVEKLGHVFTALAGGVATSVEVEVRGELSAYDVSVLQLAALKGVFASVVEEQVTFVNAPTLAAERGCEVSLTKDPDSPDHRSEITVRGVLPSGQTVSVSGTLSGPRMDEKLTDVEGFDDDLVPAEHHVFLRYGDRPGVVGTVGAALGEAQVNIAGAQVSRTSQGGDALMALTVDSAVPVEVLDAIGAAIGAHSVRAVDLT
jgi:D-3-phosphoglycerate dehydrogenase